MIEVIHIEASTEKIEEIERLLKRSGAYIQQGYKLVDFRGSDEKIEVNLTVKGESEERRIGFV